jgi:hypothetical protein
VGLLEHEQPGDAQDARHELDRLPHATGGIACYPETPAQLEQTVVAIAHEIRNQYLMGFVPAGPLDGSYRRLRVEAKGREPLVVRTREGYRAIGEGPSAR